MKNLIYTLLTLALSINVFGQKIELPKDFKEKIRIEYNSISLEHKRDELKQDFETYYQNQVKSYISHRTFLNDVGQQPATDMCLNGTFESGQIDINTWNFYWERGNRWDNTPPINGIGLVNSGYFNLPERTASEQVRVKIQSTLDGQDPTFATLDRVYSFPTSNTNSVRLGNRINGNGIVYFPD